MHCKLVLLGNSSVGKSSLTIRFVKGDYFDYQESTIGAAFLTKSMIHPESGKEIKFEIWDTAGQERYHSLAPMYYRGASAAIVCYDITDRSSLDKAKIWAKEVTSSNPDVVIAFIGTKLDLENHRSVSIEEGQIYAEENGYIFMETSAKKNIHVNEVFEAIVRALPEKVVHPETPSFYVEDYQESSSWNCCT